MSPASSDSGSVEDDALPSEKNANLIMGTNSSSIVSKRSVERLYLPKPHFYRYFVKKPQRRSPTINRGYWLRMKAIDCVVRRFLERETEQQKVVINLGAGYDTIPFQWLTTEPALCNNTKFIDVDYDDLMKSKRDIVLNTPELNDLFTVGVYEAQHNNVLYNSEQYAIIGCDLKNLRTLKRAIKTVVDIGSSPVLCVSEVALAYMATEDADAVLAWASTLSSDVAFCLLEQWCPDREDHPFMSTMLKHFSKLGTPLRSALTYTGVHTQTQRFQEAGYSIVEVQSLWDMWGDSRFLSPSQRMQLDYVEPFDEWEEFALFASHYAYIIAETRLEPLFPDLPPSLARRDSEASNLSDMSARTASPYRAENEWFAFKYSQNPGLEGRTHHGTAYLSPDEDAIAIYGGIGLKGRQSTTSVYAAEGESKVYPTSPPEETGARCCHTVTTLQNRQNLLVGGRGSPSSPLRDCWLQAGHNWERVHDLPEPRYRHRTVSIALPDNTHGVIVLGGKTSATKVATDHLLWSPRQGWRRLRSLQHDPVPRFGASFIRLGFNHGVLFGGMRQDGIICQGLWRWRLIVRDGEISGIKFRPSTALDTTVGIYPWIGRLGASYTVIKSELILVGGIAKAGCIPKEYEILSIVGSFSAFADHEKEMDLRTVCVSPRMDPDVPRPLLVGHSSHRTIHETTLIIGGGCTCFSFGSYWNTGAWLMYDKDQGVYKRWVLVQPSPPTSTEPQSPKALSNGLQSDLRPPNPVSVSSTAINTPEHLRNLIKAFAPKVLTGLDVGPCTQLWTPKYLKSKISASRKVIIHSSPCATMNFQRKDSFNYTTLPVHTFLDILTASAKSPDLNPHMYLRSISSTSPNSKPANLETDWPELARDFTLPPALSYISQNLHSSPLRISTNLSMWLHYDVMANILFHIASYPTPTAKQLILFPPEDIKHLSFPAGSTTSTLDIVQATPASPSKHQPQLQDHATPQLATLAIRSSTPTPTPTPTPISTSLSTPTSTSTLPSPSPSTPGPTGAGTSTTSHPSYPSQPLNPCTPPLPSNLHLPPGTHPHILTLPPNTALYIPPLWAHTALPSPAGVTNISVNTFFHTLPQSLYSAGRDVYANRDLAAYEEGRRDVQRVVGRFLGRGRGKATTKGKGKGSSGAGAGATGFEAGSESKGVHKDPEPTAGGKGLVGAAAQENQGGETEGEAKDEQEQEEQQQEQGGDEDEQQVEATIPKDIARAYLERLAAEILEKAAAI